MSPSQTSRGFTARLVKDVRKPSQRRAHRCTDKRRKGAKSRAGDRGCERHFRSGIRNQRSGSAASGRGIPLDRDAPCSRVFYFIGGAEDDQWLIRSPVASPIKSLTTMSGSNSQGSNTASGPRLTHAPFRCAALAPITSNGLAETSQVSSQE